MAMDIVSQVEVDPYARMMAIERFALPDCLHLPIAARREEDIRRFVGRITRVIASGPPCMALVVEAGWTFPVDPYLAIWGQPGATELRRQIQLWVHVDFRGYRSAFERAFPGLLTADMVVDHVLNRRLARLKDFQYLRVCAISRGANSSSGGLSEKWAVEYHRSQEMRAKNLASPARIQHADLADIVKMMDLKTGGTLQDPVNAAQALLRSSAPGAA
jgi:hypothetical protein